MSDKGRKPEDRSNVHKGSRGSPVSGLTQAAMMPPGSYEITPSPHHLHHHLPYGTIMRPPAMHHMPPHIGRLTSNDLGPPIFMPSLNLGIPKPQSSSSSSQANTSSVLGNPPGGGGGNGAVSTANATKSTKPTMPPQASVSAPAFMQELLPFPSAFHPTHAMRAGSGQSHTSYIPVSAPPPPHPSSMNMKLPPSQSLPSSTTGIAKPTPIPASIASHTSGGIVRPTPKSASGNQNPGTTVKQPVQTSSKGVMSSVGAVSKGEVPGNIGSVYGFQPHMMSYGLMNAAAANASAPPTLSKMLLGSSGGGSQQHPHTQSNRAPPAKSEASSKTASAQVSSTVSHKAGGYVVDGYPPTGRSTVSLSTSTQPSSTAATYMDTKLEHPPQPSAVPVGSQHPLSSHPLPSSSAGVLSVPPTSPPPPPLIQHNNNGFGTNGGGAKERPITAEAAASNLIISRQALTGKQIASITGSATTTAALGQSGLPESTYTSPHSNSGVEMSSANPPSFNRSSSSDGVVSREQGTGMMEWSAANAQNRPSASTSSYVVPPGQGVVAVPPSSVAEFHDGGGGGGAPLAQQQQQGLVLQSNGSTVDPTSLPVATSSISISFSAAGQMAGGGGNIMGSPSKNLTASPGGTGLSSSPRPHILRGVKRPHESSWKENTHHSPGSSTFLNKLSNNSSLKQKGLRQDYGSSPMSPTSHDTGLSNHINTTVVKPEPGGGDMTASPRKKPRKQNVVANDDQYASNVPDGFISTATLDSQGYHEGQGEEFTSKPRPSLHNSVATRNSKLKGEAGGGGGKEVEMRYLSQLKKCPYPINGVYKVHHRAARNHFRRHADIKHREESRLSVYEIADDKTAIWRASGWKIRHFTSQLQEMTEVEEDILKTIQRLQDSVNNLDQTGTCQVDPKCHSSFKELVQGNLDRSCRVLSHYNDTKSEIDKVLEHRTPITELLKKYSTSKSLPQSLLLLNHHHHHQKNSS